MSIVAVHTSNTRPDFSGTLTFAAGTTLTSASVTLTTITLQGTKSIDGRSCTVTIDNSAKTIAWSCTTSAFTVPGTYYVYLTVTFSDGDTMDVDKDADGDPLLIEVTKPYGQ